MASSAARRGFPGSGKGALEKKWMRKKCGNVEKNTEA